MDAAEKFWTIPELVERLVSLLDPLSTLRLIESKVMEKEILQKSLSFAAWSSLIRGTSNGEQEEEDVRVLVKILQFMEPEELSTFLMPLLDLICESRPGDCNSHVMLICPSHQRPHWISTYAFLLLEEVEGAFGTTEQIVEQVVCGWGCADLLLAVSSRMSRQREIVRNIQVEWGSFHIKDKSRVEAFLTLLKARGVYIEALYVGGEIGEGGWLALNGALQGKEYVLAEVCISRQDLTDVRDISIKGIWDATMKGIRVLNNDSEYSQHVYKYDHDWEQAWARLKLISDLSEDEFTAECQLREAS